MVWSGDGEDDLALDIATGGAFVGTGGVGEREDAVDDDADGAVVKQAGRLGQLRATRTDLCRRDGNAQRLGFGMSGEAQRIDRV